MKPTANTTTWQVYTTNDIYNPGFATDTMWRWVVHGPRGSEAGVEGTAEYAIQKAQGAAVMLMDPREAKR